MTFWKVLGHVCMPALTYGTVVLDSPGFSKQTKIYGLPTTLPRPKTSYFVFRQHLAVSVAASRSPKNVGKDLAHPADDQSEGESSVTVWYIRSLSCCLIFCSNTVTELSASPHRQPGLPRSRFITLQLGQLLTALLVYLSL